MKTGEGVSILYPNNSDKGFKTVSATAMHDIGLDSICEKLSNVEVEQKLIMNVIAKMPPDVATVKYRCDVFDDIMKFPRMRERITELLDRIQFLKDFGSFKRELDSKPGIWKLLHRMDEIKDFIECIEAISECLSKTPVRSEGLVRLREYVGAIYEDASFREMKKDIEKLRASTQIVRSVTVGINLNERFEATGLGLISINDKHFKSSNIVSNFANAVASKEGVRNGNDWNGDMHYHEVTGKEGILPNAMQSFAKFQSFVTQPIFGAVMASTVAAVPEKDSAGSITHFMDHEVGGMLSLIVKKLRETLSRYVNVGIYNITALIPEFTYYIRWAEYIEGLMKKGLKFCKAEALEDSAAVRMRARGFYNLKLCSIVTEENGEIVPNDLDFDDEHNLYILTGANRGGKTTVTQAAGQLFALAQGGIYVPCESFSFVPADCIYTHFPADEDKTMDLGRLGEECTRFREIYGKCTDRSIVLLNETFSTTSFEEGYYIAFDSVRALLQKGARTIYNTHMHKLAADIKALSADGGKWKAASLVTMSDGGSRSFKVKTAPPQGMSFAKDIAEKYGVTFEMLVSGS